ncbi:replication factor C subunit [Thermoplasma volcanium GSS1]|uniref:Replication factor C large subunit n=1 Tax=Thermoplasma volcanium (strain ATCC 51530 / DSM 4299 / JCM 9571 / NBRC 15438 / GSS1) TaxID=273116 RepID=RFCL_THEVO|nr:replication factor C large subunit [Thermoplasma volcanium]Q97BC2.1 RecName: Full=Replication factor C large subunit; Short=RFC large subunit; AltName: Full=Clamp loader large subunit [Thermoplasma volcanium GSS1]BAB59676.1 replication factor C subunit [Thermoplasma volcanium GSS1]
MEWADKYRPKRIEDLIVSEEIRQKIQSWIDAWEEGSPKKRALILYGVQGSGKTSAAYAIAGTFGLPVVEMNASEQRNRESMKATALMASLYADLGASDFRKPSKVILIDEADNIFESNNPKRGGDTGGVYELSKIVKETRNPVIITMNDFYEFRKKNYSSEVINNSESIEFKPYARRLDRNYNEFKKNVRNRIKWIINQEGFSLPDDIINSIIDKNAPDIRSIINDVEAAAVSQSSISQNNDRDTVESVYYLVDKAFKKNYDDTLKSIYGSDVDSDYFINWVEENLPSKTDDISDLNSAYEQLSFADHILWAIERKRHFDLMTFPMEIAGGLAYYIENPKHEYVKFHSPSYINSMSRSKERRHALNAVSLKIGLLLHMSGVESLNYVWFYRLMFKVNAGFRDTVYERLNLTQGEEAVLES